MVMTPDVSVVVVSYNTRDLLRECLTSVLNTECASVEIIVVDNASRDGSAEMVEAEFPPVHVIRSGGNRGFAVANNIGFARAAGRFILLLNPDAIVEPMTIATLASILDRNPDAGVCGPRVLFPDGTFQSCGNRFPTPLAEMRDSKRFGRAIGWFSPEELAPAAPHSTMDVDWVDGCCLLATRSIIREIGGLDEQYFMYGEELDFCRMVKNIGRRVVAVPDATATHHVGQSAGGVSTRAMRWITESRLRYYRKHRGLVVAAAMSAWFTAGYLKQAFASPASSRAKLAGVRDWWRAILRAPTGHHGP